VEVDDAAGWLWLDQALYMPVFRRLAAFDRPASRICVFGTGLGVSPGSFFENGIIQGEISYQLLKTRVFLFQFFEPVSLFHPHTAIFLPPAVVGHISQKTSGIKTPVTGSSPVAATK